MNVSITTCRDVVYSNRIEFFNKNIYLYDCARPGIICLTEARKLPNKALISKVKSKIAAAYEASSYVIPNTFQRQRPSICLDNDVNSPLPYIPAHRKACYSLG